MTGNRTVLLGQLFDDGSCVFEGVFEHASARRDAIVAHLLENYPEADAARDDGREERRSDLVERLRDMGEDVASDASEDEAVEAFVSRALAPTGGSVVLEDLVLTRGAWIGSDPV